MDINVLEIFCESDLGIQGNFYRYIETFSSKPASWETSETALKLIITDNFHGKHEGRKERHKR